MKLATGTISEPTATVAPAGGTASSQTLSSPAIPPISVTRTILSVRSSPNQSSDDDVLDGKRSLGRKSHHGYHTQQPHAISLPLSGQFLATSSNIDSNIEQRMADMEAKFEAMQAELAQQITVSSHLRSELDSREAQAIQRETDLKQQIKDVRQGLRAQIAQLEEKVDERTRGLAFLRVDMDQRETPIEEVLVALLDKVSMHVVLHMFTLLTSRVGSIQTATHILPVSIRCGDPEPLQRSRRQL